MPRISVVVPIYNVERYLTDCLESLAQQTMRDLEVVMVDDGSTDSSATIAAAFAERDQRFRLIQQPNGGLGHARNTGAEQAGGELLAFVDSDDVVVRHGYELLAASLAETGSDFATGNFHRLTMSGTRQAGMVAAAFTAARPKTHVSKHQALLQDRTAWNKLWRRTFWEGHAFRWPEGVLYEDIPVTIPAHVLARSVDVIRTPIYLWRQRAGDSTSITQRRTEPRAIRDRCAAVDGVSRFLAERGDKDLKKAYDRACAAQDLRYFLQPLDKADSEFRLLFLDLVNDFFDRARSDVFDPLPAIDRLKYHLVRRRLMPELLEVLRFDNSAQIDQTPVVRKGRRLYGDYPFRGDKQLDIPDGVYRLTRDELPIRSRIDDLWWEGDVLQIRGYVYIAFHDLTEPGSSRIRLTLEETGHPEGVVALPVTVVHRPDVTEKSKDGFTCYDWSGFEAAVDAGDLRVRGAFRDGEWRLRAEVRSGGVTRRTWVTGTKTGRANRPELHALGGSRIIPTTETGWFAVEVEAAPAVVHSVRLDGSGGSDGTVLELDGTLHGRSVDPATAELRLARQDGAATLSYPVAFGGPAAGVTAFQTRLALADVLAALDVSDLTSHVEDVGDGVVWELTLRPRRGAGRLRLAAGGDLPDPRTTVGGREMVLSRTRTGRLRVLERHFRPEVDGWDRSALAADGTLALRGCYDGPDGPLELLLRATDRDEEHAFPIERDGSRFSCRLQPVGITTLAGELPLRKGRYEVFAGRADGRRDDAVRVTVARSLLPHLPLEHLAEDGPGLRFSLRDVDVDNLLLVSDGQLPRSVRGAAGQRRLRKQEFPAFLRSPVLEQVLVDAYGRGAYAGDARALHEELLRRDAGLAVLWTVDDGQAAVPDGVRAVVRDGPDWYEAMARSRYLMTADFRRVHEQLPAPAHQTVLQTWHGAPFTRLGLDDDRSGSRLGRGWAARVRGESARWQYLVSAGPVASAVLRRAFDYRGTMLETGLPRNDLFFRADRDEVAGRVRDRLGLGTDQRVVLYAPTYRPDRAERRLGPDRYRLDLDLDLEEAAKQLGDDVALLVRPHPKVVDTVTAADGRFAVDVSRYPDVQELMLVADVLVTDYSSLVFDFANTGRPMVFYGHDLDYYREHLGGFYVDPTDLPGRIVRTQDELLHELAHPTPADPDTYAAFSRRHCPLDDGGAAARVLDAVLR